MFAKFDYVTRPKQRMLGFVWLGVTHIESKRSSRLVGDSVNEHPKHLALIHLTTFSSV